MGKNTITTIISEQGAEAGKFGSATSGLLLGGFLSSKLPELEMLKKIPGVGEILAKIAPGMLLMLAAYIGNMKISNEYAKNALMGLGMSGVLDILRRTGILDKINKAAPTGLSGLRGMRGVGIVQNYGEYPPDYFMKSNWAGRSLNGPGQARSFTLQGGENKPMGLQGSGKAFGLQGAVGCMFQ